jgi:crotonobetainyl-CoA:carnitine CoA-transferase CaiB-like acyl-CoA transferase
MKLRERIERALAAEQTRVASELRAKAPIPAGPTPTKADVDAALQAIRRERWRYPETGSLEGRRPWLVDLQD